VHKRKNQAFDAHILHMLHINCISQTLSEYKFLSCLHAQNLICFHCCEPKLYNTFLCDIQVSQDQHHFNNMDAIGLLICVQRKIEK
jgi:hypothetical protein